MTDIHEGHRTRLKTRFVKQGLENFEPHNVLELLLFFGIPRKDTNELAHRLVDHFGSFHQVLAANYEELCKVKGVSANTATLISLIVPLMRYYSLSKQKDVTTIQTTEQMGNYLIPKFLEQKIELVYMVCLDAQYTILFSDVLFQGSMNSVPIYIRNIIEKVYLTNAHSVIIAHNHPSGYALPSNDDVVNTQKIKDALDASGVYLMDHIIIAENDWVSFRQSGYLS